MKYSLSVPCVADWERAKSEGKKVRKEVVGIMETGYELNGAFYFESADMHLVYRSVK